MSGSTYVAIDGAEFEFEPHRPAKFSLLICSVTSFSAIVFLVRAGVYWTEFERGDVVLLSFTGLAWTTWSVTCLVTIYARSLPPTQTWLWEAARRIMAYFSILWFATFGLCLTLTSRTFYSALICDLAEPECCPIEHRIAIEIYISSSASLLVAVLTSILLAFELHSHRWLGIDPTPRPLEEGWASRPLLPGDRMWNGLRGHFEPAACDYSDHSASEEDRQSRPTWPTSLTASSTFSYPPPSYIERVRAPLSPQRPLSGPLAMPNPFAPRSSILGRAEVPQSITLSSLSHEHRRKQRKKRHTREHRHHHKRAPEPSTDESTTSTDSTTSSSTSDEDGVSHQRRRRNLKKKWGTEDARKKRKAKLRAKQESQVVAMGDANRAAGTSNDVGGNGVSY